MPPFIQSLAKLASPLPVSLISIGPSFVALAGVPVQLDMVKRRNCFTGARCNV